MKKTLAAMLILLSAGLAFAVVGGGEIAMKNEGGDAVFSHEAHVGAAGLQCRECHTKVYLNTKKHLAATMKEMESGKSCGVCHDGTAAFGVKEEENCGKCHAQAQTKEGEDE